jgi:hypothetical protein
MAELLTRASDLTTADVTGQVDTHGRPDGPTLVKGQPPDTLDARVTSSTDNVDGQPRSDNVSTLP